MALITDPDLLNQATEVVYDTSAKTIELVQAGNLSTDGVTLKALYSFTKEEWRADATKPGFKFPFTPITDESFELIDGWNFLDSASKYLVRTAGWTVVDEGTGNPSEIWSGIVGLGSIESDDQLYFDQGVGATDFQLTGQVNQAVQVYSDTNADGTPDFDYRTVFTMYVREQGQIFGQSSIGDIGVSTMQNIAYRFPISTATDLKITASDADITTLAPYTGMSITYHQVAQSFNIGGSNFDFGITIDGNGGTAEQIYEFVQYQLRQSADIDSEADAPTQVGQLQDELLRFVGDNLETLAATNADGGGTGVYITNFDSADTNRISFVDNTDTTRTFPFVASLTVNFNNNLQNDTASKFWVFFTNDDAGDNVGNDYDTAGAIIVSSNDSFSTTLRERTSNVATVTLDATHGLEVGDFINLSSMGDASYDGIHELTAVTATTVSFDSVGTDEASTADVTGSSATLMAGLVDSVSSLSFTFDYDGNIQRGAASAGLDAPITVVALGLDTGQYVRATGTIARSNANSVSLVAPLERNYENA